MAVNETIVTGRKWRRCIDVANKLWQRISYWTKASDVEFDDGQTAENKMGAISGITSDLNGESENIAASIKAVNQLNNNLTFPDGVKFYPDIKDGERGYNTDPARGADTFRPFKQTITPKFIGYVQNDTYTFNETYDSVIAFRSYDSRSPHYAPSCSGIGSVQLISDPIQGIGLVNHTTYILSDVGVGATYRGCNAFGNTNDITFFFALAYD